MMSAISGFPVIPTLHVSFTWDFPKMDPACRIASVGSCFSEEISSLLAGAGLSVVQNPNGILYNPVSIAEALERAARGEVYTEKDFFPFGGMWHSFQHHGRFSSPDPAEGVRKANESLLGFRAGLVDADLILVTLSSSVVYEYRKTGRITANCHKLPPDEFTCRVLKHEECVHACRRIVESIRACSREGIILFTVSPVRHYPGNVVLNSISKARIRCAVEEMLDREKVVYFPAYEIVNDELRDYRFYNEDMVHPSPLAVKIVTETFLQHCFTPAVSEKVRLWRKACAAEKHVPRADR